MEIIRSNGPLCPVLMEAMFMQHQRIMEFYEEDMYIISPSNNTFTLSVKIDGSLITLQQTFPTVADAVERAQFCKHQGIAAQAETRYEHDNNTTT